MALVVSLLITLAVWGVRRVGGAKVLPAASVPSVLAVVAIAIAIAALILLGQPWHEALSTGFLVASAAGGLWGMLGKHLLPLPSAETRKKP